MGTTDYSVVIDLILNGLAQLDDLSASIKSLKQSAKEAEKAATSLAKVDGAARKSGAGLKKAGDDASRAERQMLSFARATAQLQTAEGKTAQAVDTLTKALSQANAGTLAYIQTQKQLVATEARIQTSASKSDSELLKRAQLLARIQQLQGNQKGGADILSQAAARVNPNSLNALRAKIQQIYFETDYKNSPLISAIRNVQNSLSSVGVNIPGLGRGIDILSKLTSSSTQAAQGIGKVGFSVTESARKMAAASSQAATASKSFISFAAAKNAALRFAKDETGSFDLEAFLQSLTRTAENSRTKLTGIFEGIKAALRGLFTGAEAGGGEVVASEVAGIGVAAAGATVLVGALAVAIVGVVTAAIALKQGIDLLTALGKAGVASNTEIEKLQFGIAAVIAGTNKISKDGIDLKGADKFAASFALAGDTLDKIVEEAGKLGLPVQEVAEGFQIALGPLSAMGVSLEDSRKTALAIAVAMRDLGIPLREIGQETRGLLQGDTSKQSRLNSILRIKKEELEVWKKEGTVADEIQKKLEDFTLAGEMFRRSMEGGLQSAKTSFDAWTRDVTKGLFEQLRDSLANAFEVIGQAGGLQKFIANTSTMLQDIFNTVGARAQELIDWILQKLLDIDDFIGTNKETIDEIIVALDEIVGFVGEMVSGFFEGDRNVKEQSTSLKVVSTVLRVVLTLLYAIRDIWRIITSVIETAGYQLKGVVLGAIALVAATLARLLKSLPLIGNLVGDAANMLGNLAKEALGGAATATQHLKDNVSNFGREYRTAMGHVMNAEERLEQKRNQMAAARKRNIAGLKATPNKTDDEEDADKGKQKRARALRDKEEQELKAETGLQKALLALKLAYGERDEQRAKFTLEKESALLDQAFEDRKVGLTAYYAKKEELIKKSTQLDLKAIQDQIEAERTRFAEIDAMQQKEMDAAERQRQRDLAGAQTKDERLNAERKFAQQMSVISSNAEKERLDVDKRILELQTQMEAASARGAEKEAENARKKIVAYREFMTTLESVKAELLSVQGNELPAALLAIDTRFRQTLEFAQQEFGVASDTVRTINALIEKLKENAKAQEAIRVARQGVDVSDATLDLNKARIQTLVTQGLLTERQERQAILDVQRAYVREVLPALDAEIAATRALGKEHEAEAIRLEARREQLKQLLVDTQSLSREVSKSLQDNLLNVLDRIGDGITSVKQAFTELATGILKDVKRMVNERIIDALFGGKQGADGQVKPGLIPGLLDKIFGGGNKNQPGGLASITGGAGTASTGLQATNQNTQATIANTQALVTVVNSLSGSSSLTDAGNAAASSGGGILGGLLTKFGLTVPGANGAKQDMSGLAAGSDQVSQRTNLGYQAKSVKSPIYDAVNLIYNTLLITNGILEDIVVGLRGTPQQDSARGGGVLSGLGGLGGLFSGDTNTPGIDSSQPLGGFVTQGEFGTQPGEGQIGMSDITDTTGSASGLSDIFGGLFKDFFGGATARVTNVLDGLNKIIELLTTLAQRSQQGGGGGFNGLLASFFNSDSSFAGGGFTGGSPATAAAGVVHGGEFVFSAPAVSRLGVGYLAGLHSAAKRGYATGGYVSGSVFAQTGLAAPANANRGVTIIGAATDDEVEQAAMSARARGDDIFMQKWARNRRRIQRLGL